MDVLKLANEIINGKRITENDNLNDFITCPLEEISEGANLIRESLCKNNVELCSIINAKSGRCSENCKYCAQSIYNHTNCETYDFLEEEKIIKIAKENETEGVKRIALVTAGRALNGKDFEKALEVYSKLKEECKINLCASMGLLTKEQFQKLKDVGVTRYHHNIETSRRNFPNICTTHTYDDKMHTIENAKSVGLEVCSGGIIGMGETWQDRLDMAKELSVLGIKSIPINVLTPIKGSSFENLEPISEDDIVRTFAFFRYINPEAKIRLAAGRLKMTNNGERIFCSGANATITGNMLTTSGATIKGDIQMLQSMNRTV